MMSWTPKMTSRTLSRRRGRVGAPIVHQDHLVGEAARTQRLSDRAPQGAQIPFFVEDGDHQGEQDGLRAFTVHGSGLMLGGSCLMVQGSWIVIQGSPLLVPER